MQADPAALERRRDHPVPRRPQVVDDPQLARFCVPDDEIAELDPLGRADGLPAEPVAADLGVLAVVSRVAQNVPRGQSRGNQYSRR